MNRVQLKSGVVLTGPIFPEPVEVLQVQDLNGMVKIIGFGKNTNISYNRVLHPAQLANIQASSAGTSYDGDPNRFRLGIDALRLGIAYEYDPFFSLSIARIDPLPHQLEAVYEYFLKLPRIRFLLADDPGAGKTVMAGLLLKELKIRGLVKRTLIVTPANLTFQWQREMHEKFGEDFEVIRGEHLRANYGANPWQDKDQVVTSISWTSRIEDAKESLLRAHWDLVIVDEAHKMAAYSADKKTLAYKLGEQLGAITDHYLLMTATPHKGDAENFCLFLQLLDPDIYGNIKSLEEAMLRNHAPFYLRRTKEALITFPDPETGIARKLYPKREVRTAAFDLSDDEYEFYDALTRYVEDQSIKAFEDDSARGRAIGFTMAMLQRRFASSVYAARRTLERMRDKRQDIAKDPTAWRKSQVEKNLPENFDELPEEDQFEILRDLEGVVAAVDATSLREDIQALNKLVKQAIELEKRGIEVKLKQLRKVLEDNQILGDPDARLLIFTEHKDTLDFLVGDGKDGRPLGKLREWGLKVTQIHGGMKVGDRDTPGTRIYAEREFRESAQILVATEAAGEGINLQFCWFMVNYDMPWNPVRLEQRMGRIHRYGQEHDCLILNFVAQNTNEGRVLHKLLERLDEIRRQLGTDQVFDVVGEVLPGRVIEGMFREMYARRMTVQSVEERIVREVDPERFRRITEGALEGLAKKSLNLSALVGRSVEARERRLVPEAVEEFFVSAAPLVGVLPKAQSAGSGAARGGRVLRVGKLSKAVVAAGDQQQGRYGKLGREYGRVAFDKNLIKDDPTLEWVTPGHALFEAVRIEVARQVREDLARGAVFWDLQRAAPGRLDVFSSAIKDGRGHTISQRLFAVDTDLDGGMTLRNLAYLTELVPAPQGTTVPDDGEMPNEAFIEGFLIGEGLDPFRAEVDRARGREVEVMQRHLRVSMEALIHRANLALIDLEERLTPGATVAGLDGLIKQAEGHVDALNHRYDLRKQELAMERELLIGDIERIGRAWVLPHPARETAEGRGLVRDEGAHAAAVCVAEAYERSRGWEVERVVGQHRGFDLLSRGSRDARFVLVQAPRADGTIALGANELRTARRLGQDGWLYIVAEGGSVHVVRDPARLSWREIQGVGTVLATLESALTLAGS